MNKNETAVFDDLEARGITVFRNGWPDFLCVAPDDTVFAVEVKAGNDRIRAHQADIALVLEDAQIPVILVYSDRGTVHDGGRLIHTYWKQQAANMPPAQIGEIERVARGMAA